MRWLSSSRSERRGAQLRCQPTPIPTGKGRAGERVLISRGGGGLKHIARKGLLATQSLTKSRHGVRLSPSIRSKMQHQVGNFLFENTKVELSFTEATGKVLLHQRLLHIYSRHLSPPDAFLPTTEALHLYSRSPPPMQLETTGALHLTHTAGTFPPLLTVGDENTPEAPKPPRFTRPRQVSTTLDRAAPHL